MVKQISKKGQMSGGLITGLIFGIASLVIGVIIAFVIVSTLTGANLLTSSRTTSTPVLNESGADINVTGYQLAALDAQYVPGTITVTSVINNSDEAAIPAANYTVSSTGIITNATAKVYGDVRINYSSSVYSEEEQSTTLLSGNFTSGVDNVSAKIPTVLLVAAIVLILGVLALLVAAWQRMRIGGGSI